MFESLWQNGSKKGKENRPAVSVFEVFWFDFILIVTNRRVRHGKRDAA